MQFNTQPAVMGSVQGIVYRSIATHLIRKAGYTKAMEEGPMDQLLGHSITYRIAVGLQQGRKVFTWLAKNAWRILLDEWIYSCVRKAAIMWQFTLESLNGWGKIYLWNWTCSDEKN